MATLTIELSTERFKQLQELAALYNVKVEELARVGVEELLAQPSEEFRRIRYYVVEKNAELYKRRA